MASTDTKSKRKSTVDRQNTNALIQWAGVAAVIVLGIVAIFVFEIGGTSSGGHGGVITGQLV